MEIYLVCRISQDVGDSLHMLPLCEVEEEYQNCLKKFVFLVKNKFQNY